MRTRLVGTVFALAALVAAGRPAHAQLAAPTVELTPYAGYMHLGNYADGPLGTNLSSSNGYVLGAQLALKLTPNIALVGNVAHANADLQVGVPILGGIGVGNSKVWLYDGGVQLGVPATAAAGVGISPFVQLGVGAIRHDVGSSLLRTHATNLAYNAGIGADVMLGRSLGLRVMAKDYIGRFDAKEATGFDLNTEMRHNIAVSAGVKLAF